MVVAVREASRNVKLRSVTIGSVIAMAVLSAALKSWRVITLLAASNAMVTSSPSSSSTPSGGVDVRLDPDAVIGVRAAVGIEPDLLFVGDDEIGVAARRPQIPGNPFERVACLLLGSRVIELNVVRLLNLHGKGHRGAQNETRECSGNHELDQGESVLAPCYSLRRRTRRSLRGRPAEQASPVPLSPSLPDEGGYHSRIIVVKSVSLYCSDRRFTTRSVNTRRSSVGPAVTAHRSVMPSSGVSE